MATIVQSAGLIPLGLLGYGLIAKRPIVALVGGLWAAANFLGLFGPTTSSGIPKNIVGVAVPSASGVQSALAGMLPTPQPAAGLTGFPQNGGIYK